jgi:hypothetical protein
VILSGKQKEGAKDPNRVDRFEADIFDMQTGRSTKATEAYLLPDGDVIVRGENMFIFPVTKLQLFGDKEGYVLAYKLDYFKKHDDDLSEISAKTELNTLHDQVINACINGINGKQNGLAQFFNRNNHGFEGFYMPPSVSRDPIKLAKFFESINENFTKYYKAKEFESNPPDPETCRESMRGLGLIVSAAAVLNGYWLPEISDYLQK